MRAQKNRGGRSEMSLAHLASGGNGIIYGVVAQDGRLLFYRDEHQDGTNAPNGSTGWSANSGNQIGQHWEGARLLAGGGDGILYVVHQDGRLLFYRDEHQDGTNAPNGSTGWSTNSGNQIGQHWEQIKQIICGPKGVIYAVHQDGRLFYYRDESRDGSNAPDGSTGWDTNSGKQIGQGWA
ncbi:tachylectin-related carbohydrate-binding protein [Streptomyces sp. NPDC051452]|uniref:tachylectin-related carbohydrate-binding protein n=1 Tax=Streptomyces sp. NPDC051452 TaxID=3365654 RepID=UPI003791C9A0